jgi:ATP-binding cassette subfamily C protein
MSARRVNTPVLLQMEAVECGAASLGIICSYFGSYLPLEQLRTICGVSRDGTSAKNIVVAARTLGMKAQGFKKTAQQALALPFPFIVFWESNHFLVVEGATENKVFLNDPALGKIWVTPEEFAGSYSGVVLQLEPAEGFKKQGAPFNVTQKIWELLSGSKRTLYFLLFAALLALAPALVIPSITRIFIDFVLIQNNTFWLVPIMVSLGAAILINAALMMIQQTVIRRLNTKLSVLLAYRLLVKIFHLPMSFYQQRSKAEISSRVEFANLVAESLTGSLLSTVVSLLSSLFFLGVMFVYSVKLALICLVIAAVTMRLFYWLGLRRNAVYNRFVKDSSSLSGVSYTGLQAIESIKSSARENEFFRKWAGFHARYLISSQQTRLHTTVSRALPGLLSLVNLGLILLIGGYEVMKGDLSVGLLLTFTVLFQQFFVPVQRVADSSSELSMLGSYFRSLYDILHYPDKENTRQLTPSVVAEQLSGAISLQALSFGYNQMAPPIINDISLQIPRGQSFAFIGLSGSGKSTLAKLITGLYEPWKGSVQFDGKDLEQLPKALRTASIGMVDQEIELFAGTVKDVLTFWDESIAMEHIIHACRLAEIHDVISKRPGGYFSQLHEGGRNFSGGERQRMEIARALIKKPRILVLDEATSALDPETEFRICQNIKGLGITLVIIAHRLSTIRDCDQIIVLNRGVIEHRGTHEVLLRDSPLYQQFLKETE